MLRNCNSEKSYNFLSINLILQLMQDYLCLELQLSSCLIQELYWHTHELHGRVESALSSSSTNRSTDGIITDIQIDFQTFPHNICHSKSNLPLFSFQNHQWLQPTVSYHTHIV